MDWSRLLRPPAASVGVSLRPTADARHHHFET